MTTISVSLDDETYARLKAAADAEGLAVEDLAAGTLRNQYRSAEVSAEVNAIIERQVETYRPVFRRLGAVTRYVSVDEAIAYHQAILSDEGAPPVPLLSFAKLESAVLRPAAEAFGEEFYTTLASSGCCSPRTWTSTGRTPLRQTWRIHLARRSSYSGWRPM